ncbi:MAG TPA: DUF5007 domain-containing protein [Parapedobacter sp.]|uniref:DUF5007 domain-containing protein n=1 Tax=Parapedobacter sp. TaxID=1958893 RepID=UPI002D0197E9|nr:DUF5007 domain-containing protein [Parapedobacter sp.]HWK56438.1 DUF5007 domain-containing protein [Parapedobacter sp.]
MTSNRKIRRNIGLSILVAGSILQGCEKMFNLPEEKEYISENINYGSKILEPILGRTNLMGQFNADASTMPLTFEIVNARYGDGRPVTDLFQVRPTYVWTAAYDGLETSLEEIEAKRKLEDRPLFEVRESGQFILWASANSELIEPRPEDTTILVQETRFFDLKVTNTGGTVYIPDFQFIPWLERPYSPSNDIDPYSGDVARDPTDPENPNKRDYIRPRLDNVIGEKSNRPLQSNNQIKDVVVYIRPFEGGNGHNLRFKFMDPDDNFIDPDAFNETKWGTLVHGFNIEKTTEYVQYDVAYPIPLVNLQTPYTSSGGTNASVSFQYSRKGFGGELTYATFGLDFSIFRPGDWEIVFHFRNELPKFEDE